jgi:competence protein ComEC
VGKVKGKTVAFIRHPSALEEDCRIADIVIVPFSVGRHCSHARVVVDRRMLWSEGAHALYIEGLSIRTESVAQARGQRPWVLARPITRPPQGSTSGRALAREDDKPKEEKQQMGE